MTRQRQPFEGIQQVGANTILGNNTGSPANIIALTIAQVWAMLATVKSSGSKRAVAIKSGDYTLTTSDEVVVFTANATVSLPAATGSGQTYRIVCRAGTLTIDANGSETVKGELTQTLTAGEDLIISDTASGLRE